ncbi:hypothetical protein [Aliivibrio fischeri]|uniref:hypothetical protein n=1 Tax=Aliivibrio fischeri TaxID=668 RepID=UPI00105C2BF0|nr:hypothetical protein [Aliivibrio fischeri]TDM51387.1 hypothetical protein VFFQA001_14770 [Aliivibrio fischeri]
MEATTWGFIGTIIGAFASIATTAIISWNSYILANKTKEYEREETANVFQRETILELQTELLEYFRSCHQIYKNDRDYFEKTKQWGGSILTELNTQNRDLSAKTSMLIQRISHDELRNKLEVFKSNCTKSLIAKDKFEAEIHYDISSEQYHEINELLGKVLRNTYWQPNA